MMNAENAYHCYRRQGGRWWELIGDVLVARDGSYTQTQKSVPNLLEKKWVWDGYTENGYGYEYRYEYRHHPSHTHNPPQPNIFWG